MMSEPEPAHSPDLDPAELQIDTFHPSGCASAALSPGGMSSGFACTAVRITHKPSGVTVEATHETAVGARSLAMARLKESLGEDPADEDSASIGS